MRFRMAKMQRKLFDAVKEYAYPVCFNFPAGHIERNLALYLGAKAQLAVTKKRRVFSAIGKRVGQKQSGGFNWNWIKAIQTFRLNFYTLKTCLHGFCLIHLSDKFQLTRFINMSSKSGFLSSSIGKNCDGPYRPFFISFLLVHCFR